MRLIRAKLRKIRVQKHFKNDFQPIFDAYNQLIILDFILLKIVTEMHMFSTFPGFIWAVKSSNFGAYLTVEFTVQNYTNVQPGKARYFCIICAKEFSADLFVHVAFNLYCTIFGIKYNY